MTIYDNINKTVIREQIFGLLTNNKCIVYDRNIMRL